jgi:hypothetical protein
VTKKSISFILFFILTTLKVAAFNSDTLYFIGKIKITGGNTYPYALRFVILPNNKIKGYSLTDTRGFNETKNRIIGSFDSINRKISFVEQAVLRSKVDTSSNTLCYIQSTLQIKLGKLGQELSGKFTGISVSDKKPCGKGNITLNNVQGIKDLRARLYFTEAYKPDQIIDSKKSSDTSVVSIFSSDPKAFIFTDRNIRLYVWDNRLLDGDQIDISLNGNYLEKKYSLTTTPKLWEISLPDLESSTLTFKAINEGMSPPNTAMIILESSSERYHIELKAKKDETRILYLRRRNSSINNQ